MPRVAPTKPRAPDKNPGHQTHVSFPAERCWHSGAWQRESAGVSASWSTVEGEQKDSAHWEERKGGVFWLERGRRGA